MVNDTSLDSEEQELRKKKLEVEIKLRLEEIRLTEVKTEEQKLKVLGKYIATLLASIAFLGGVPPRGPLPISPIREAPIPPREPLARDQRDKTDGKADPNIPPICTDPLLCRIDEILKEGMRTTITLSNDGKSIKHIQDALTSYKKMIHDLKELQKIQQSEAGRDAIEFYIKSLDRISK
ncbi:hypothetical protein [Nitrosospira multiformis]|uniref:Uncharacterized protein n=1 Tax=Nitrosospira multiformis TaxID=1231 RepID=A0A1I7I3D6_9PROT|nr:hypothetical protein [Nitrosospira multiformis]SFU67424.1 hypothetical protein SAMN05216417_1148 [Nitrosospira multiformis]